MLDDFKIEQPIVYRILLNSIKNDKCSHAYLFETNGYHKGLDLAISYAKYLLCPNKYSNCINCKNCNQCKTIDDNNYLELKIIEPEGQWIKKSQLIELQDTFSKKAVVGNKKIYIINGAEKLNESSSNSLLKFLEEPEKDIIAILITDNSKNLLSTIVSRCQVLSFKKGVSNIKTKDTMNLIANYLYNDSVSLNEFIEKETSQENIKKVLNFIEYFENNKYDTILYINKLWNDHFTDRKEIKNSFEILLLFYKDIINYKLNRQIEYFVDYEEVLKSISDKNSTDIISKKIKVILDLKELIKYNVNTNLLMDKLIIQLKGCE